ncbi:type II secretion system protein N [Serratia sp. L9]|uniref:type II secretion system protein N n=1 Tax=Serratia sp. L9 TaxID=3423946 RepID=UPI003D672FAE
MTSSILSMYRTLSGLAGQRTDISACGAIFILFLGLVGFLWTGWQAFTSQAINGENISVQQARAPAPFPDMALEKTLSGLYGSVARPTATDISTRFYIQGTIADDSLLLAAPRAKVRDNLVGVLMSSNPEKNMAIIESAGKQASYGLNDRIAGKFTILKIFQDRVVINENGFYATLVLQE